MSKNIIIVGSGLKLGLEIAQRFGKEGFTVGLIGRNLEKLKQQFFELTNKGICCLLRTG